MKKEMLINVLQPEECRIAIVEDGVLEELYVERTSHETAAFSPPNLDPPALLNPCADGGELLVNAGRTGRQHDDRAWTRLAHLAKEVQTHFFQFDEFVVKRDLDAKFFQVREQLVPARVAPEVDALWAAWTGN